MIAGLGGDCTPTIAGFRRTLAERGDEGVQMFFRQVANRGVRECLGEPAKHDSPVVMILAAHLRPLSATGLCARFIGGDEFLDSFFDVLPLHAGDCGQVAVHGLAQSAPAQLAGSLAIL